MQFTKAETMSKELVCPFCNKKLEPIGTSGQFQCGTWGCDASFNFYATRDVWEYIERTRKVLKKAKLVLVDLRDHTELDGIQEWEVYETISEITALEQKDK